MSNTRRRTRSTGEIDRLPGDIKNTVDQMLLSGMTYREIVDYLAENEVQLSQMSVCRYARRYLAQVEEMKIAQENMRMMLEEMEKYPAIDSAELLLNIASQNTFYALSTVPKENWEQVDPEKLIKQTIALSRAAGYKKQVDHKLQTDAEKALKQNQALLFASIEKDHPELYMHLMEALKEQTQKAVKKND